MSAPEVKGWCPGAWRPMASGDGLVVRVRPRLARLCPDQVLGLCAAAQAHGAGLIDLTNRANLQIRGVRDEAFPALLEDLAALDLLDPDAWAEARRNILIAPDWQAGDDSHRLTAELYARLADLPDLPAKAGFAIDAGTAPILTRDPADFRIERGAGGGLILRAEGRPLGVPLADDGQEITHLIRLARWFVESGGAAAGRMARHAAPLPGWAEGTEPPAPPRPAWHPGPHPAGRALGLAFGQIAAAQLADMMRSSAARGLRLTPWRVILAEGAADTTAPGFLTDEEAPALRVDACAGAPFCPQATVETRALALRLAPHVAGRLHVSGCAKGCARARPADVTLTGRDGGFDLAFNARAGDSASRLGMTPGQILAHFGAI